ncbi:recombination directionality factor [Nocardiopsis salina]|uniref:recombination directionality factor n=1 Tax=Nocardiopsis salina TaxID=245836 RepID=UPI000345B41A|nr:hypothetical protein [Nocardiopsis salina]
MPILDLQQRTRELGRIRIGQVQPTSNGRTRPAKLDRFRLTSASKPLLDQVAELYGGTVREWTPANGGAQQWEVVTDTARLPVMVPPQSVSQWYELWSGGGCQRRCDGQREVLTDSACPCGPDPAQRECKPTTRLNVVLRDVPGVGVWRLESHGYYAAVELPAVADMLSQTSGYIRAWLALEERTAKRDGQTRRWMVPTLEVDITPSELMSGNTAPGVEAPSRDWIAEVRQAGSLDELRELYTQAREAGAPSGLADAMKQRAEQITTAQTPAVTAPPAPEAQEDDGDADALWMQCVAAAPDGWSTSDLMDAYAARNGGELVDDASAARLREFLGALKEGTAAPASTTPTLDALKDKAATQDDANGDTVPF